MKIKYPLNMNKLIVMMSKILMSGIKNWIKSLLKRLLGIRINCLQLMLLRKKWKSSKKKSICMLRMLLRLLRVWEMLGQKKKECKKGSKESKVRIELNINFINEN